MNAVKVNAARSTATSLRSGTFTKANLGFWLQLHSEAQRHADELDRLYTQRIRRKLRAAVFPSKQDNAIHAGHWALRNKATYFAESIRSYGGFLFIGSPVALAMAKAAEGGAA